MSSSRLLRTFRVILACSILGFFVGCSGSDGEGGSENKPGAEEANADLSSIQISSGALAFEPDKTDYSIEVGSNVATLVLTATVEDANASLVINGSNAESGKPFDINLISGQNTIRIVVTAYDSTTTKTYNLNISRNIMSPPAVPTGVNVSPGDNQVTIRWNTVNGATSYNLYWSTIPGLTKNTGIKISNATSPYSHDSLMNGTTYYYVVTSVNGIGESIESGAASATPRESLPLSPSPSSSAIIIDHTCTTLADIPAEAINQAKATLRIAYGHSSHGSQLVDGMSGLNLWKGGGLYSWNSNGAGGALELRDYAFYDYGAEDLGKDNTGNPDRTAWAAATRSYLNSHPNEINVVIWAWCGQVSDATEAEINTYLSLMTSLEQDYPGIQFVYMTGHLDASGVNGNLHQRNEQIRQYCRLNQKILYDFADIESYDPDRNYYLDLYANDGCYYDSNGNGYIDDGDQNWAINWQDNYAEGLYWYSCGAAHTQPLNSNLKAYAAWWLWARLAGWSGQ